MAALADRIPVSILTGFLGAGKSTLLNRLLKDPAMRDAAVIINEFGEVGIDHLLVEASGDSIVQLSDGCLCCTVRGELVDTLAELVDALQTGRIKALSRVVIETTGLADPAPVMQSVLGHPVLSQSFQLEGLVTVVDAVNGNATLDSYSEAVRQVAVADRLVLTKASLSDPTAITALKGRITALNPRAPIVDAEAADAGEAVILNNGLYDPATKLPDVARWLQEEAHADAHHHDDHHGQEHDHDHDHDGHHHHDHAHSHHHHDDVTRHGASIRSFSILHDEPVDPAALHMFIDLLRSAHGEKMLRMKAIVGLKDDPERPVVIHGVQSIFHPPHRLAAWPDPSDRRSRLVMITDGLDEAYVRDLFDAFTGKVAIDRPDRQALENNPLSVPGLSF
ncbi:CobW family GTP-binding protein [Allorhizobium taibaishanense]|uniref:ATP-binding protein n=1 Tax=Allorhizobium taibaishanense TaxID=887144 RepID=A0A1Q9A1Z7_9HYPH|nr:GTP-binding protein [Allorhizobium taibaishanense]MBB4009257.1 G3E family GTPase [Allorhizobium taibaishanense]OLP48475.1 ATP-binding protein [Allorhizobium taibaishanense]